MRLVILGCGGHGLTVADIARQTEKYEEIIMLDENSDFAIGKCEDYYKFSDGDTCFYPAFGNNESRLNWENKFLKEGLPLAKIIHPLAYISPEAKISDGCVVMPFAVVNTFARVEKACIINCSAIVDHGCIIEEGCHIAPGAIVKAENRLPACTKVDSGELIQIRQYPL